MPINDLPPLPAPASDWYRNAVQIRREPWTFVDLPSVSKFVAYNGLCECRGPFDRHPFHSEPLPPEYVGKHRPKE